MENDTKFHGIPFRNNVSIMKYNTNCCQNCMFLSKITLLGGEVAYNCNFTDRIIHYGENLNNGLISNSCDFDKRLTMESFIYLGFKLISNKDDWYNFRNSKCDIYINLNTKYSKIVNIHSRGNSFIGNCKLNVSNLPELEVSLKSLNII